MAYVTYDSHLRNRPVFDECSGLAMHLLDRLHIADYSATCGVYTVSIRRMSDDLRAERGATSDALLALEKTGQVVWDPTHGTVWCKPVPLVRILNGSMLVGAVRDVERLREDWVGWWLAYYPELFTRFKPTNSTQGAIWERAEQIAADMVIPPSAHGVAIVTPQSAHSTVTVSPSSPHTLSYARDPARGQARALTRPDLTRPDLEGRGDPDPERETAHVGVAREVHLPTTRTGPASPAPPFPDTGEENIPDDCLPKYASRDSDTYMDRMRAATVQESHDPVVRATWDHYCELLGRVVPLRGFAPTAIGCAILNVCTLEMEESDLITVMRKVNSRAFGGYKGKVKWRESWGPKKGDLFLSLWQLRDRKAIENRVHDLLHLVTDAPPKPDIWANTPEHLRPDPNEEIPE